MIRNIMKEVDFQGYMILIGKNKFENALLLKTSGPKDYWIHVKDYPSGHVIIKNPNEKRIPTKVIKRACCILKSSNNKHKYIPDLQFDIAKRENISLTNNIGEVIITKSSIIKL